MSTNIQIKLIQKPSQQYPKDNSNVFQIKTTKTKTINQVPEGHILVKNKYISIDATNRVWMNGLRTYVKPVLPGDVMMGSAIGQVIYSKGTIPVGSLVNGLLGWEQYPVMKESEVVVLPKGLSNPQMVLGALGISGLTAYVGLFTIGKIKKGEVVVVSAAAGAVGEIAVQLAKLHGCIVCGIAGSDEKCQYVKSIGADFTINYKTQNIESSLKKLLPKGVDVYFDNVGGQTLDAVLMNIKDNSRIVLCGSISTYYGRSQPYKLKNYPRLIIKKCVMKGFIYFDHKQDFPKAIELIGGLLKQKKLSVRIDWQNGIEECPNALKKLLLGQNNGKVIVRVEKKQISAKL